MPDLIDVEWFASRADDAETVTIVREIAALQELALKENVMPVEDLVWELHLDRRSIYLEKSSAVNGLEIYQEIFRDADHTRTGGFIPSDGDTVLDLGANLGFYALFAAEAAPDCRYFGVEPNPYIFSLLQRNIASCRNAELLQAAAAEDDYTGEFELVRQLPSIAGATLRQIERKWLDKSIIEKVSVDYRTLGTIYRYFGLSSVDILKIDIEGYEGILLQNTPAETLRLAARIVLETHTPQIREEVIVRLGECGFELVRRDDSPKNKNYCNLYFQRGEAEGVR